MSENKNSPSDFDADVEDTVSTTHIDGEVVDVTVRNRLIMVGTGLVGGLAGAVIVGAGLYFYAPLSATGNEEDVATLAAELKALDERMQVRTGGFYSRIANAEEAIRRHTDQIGEEPIADRLEALQGFAAQVQEDLAGIDDRLATIDVEGVATRLTSLDEAIGSLSADVKALQEAQLPADLPDRIGALAQRLNAAAEQINSLALKLAAVEEEVARPDPTAEAALGIAIANLTRAVDGGHSFVSELKAIETLAPADPAVAALSSVAPLGVKSFATLKSQFTDLVDPLLVADRQAGRETLWERFVGNILSIVTVRRVGDVEGDSTEAIVARIESRLQAEDLEGALSEAQKLSGAPAELIAPWIAEAQARVTTDRLVRDLSARVLALVASGGE